MYISWALDLFEELFYGGLVVLLFYIHNFKSYHQVGWFFLFYIHNFKSSVFGREEQIDSTVVDG